MHVMTRSPRPARSPSSSGRRAPAAPTTRRPSRSTRPSCSRRSATLVPLALASLDRGGTLAIAGIHLSDIPSLNYERHLFQERTLRSVTANTRADGEEFLAAAAGIPIKVATTPYAMADANEALRDLAHDRVTGAAVLVNDVPLD